MKYQAIADQYDSFYNSETVTFSAGTPGKLLAGLCSDRPTGTVLDLGGGSGVYALYLARKGFTVTVVDCSRVGLQKLQQQAETEGLVLSTQQADITQYEISSSYDVVLCSMVLHHVAVSDAWKLVQQLQTMATQGQVHLIVTFINNGGLYERNKYKERFYPSESELKSLYAEWKIHECVINEVTTLATAGDGIRLQNELIMLRAEKV